MFGLFTTPVFRYPVLGAFKRSRGHWRGTIELSPGQSVPLVLAGPRSEPDPQAIAIARTLPGASAGWRPRIEAALFEHYQPYAEAIAAGELEPSGGALPPITSPGDVWPHVTLEYVAVTPLGGALTIEFGYDTAWDEEHTLGARVQNGMFVGLNGSVLPP
jgi:hypothetical protein